jgi:hypothetical protein
MRTLRSLVLVFIIVTVCLLAAVSCASALRRASSPWIATDLRYLDPAGNAENPSTDILAVYARVADQDFQIRIDLLDLSFNSEYQVIVLVYEDRDSPRLGLTIEPDKMSSVFDFSTTDWSQIQPRVVRDPWLDTITISFNRNLLADQSDFTITTLTPSKNRESFPLYAYDYEMIDKSLLIQNRTPFIRLDDPPPTARAPALIAFTDTFPAATPAQAFRRWDGAHTGPTGERHGLKHILDAARGYGIPIALVDLKTPSSLAALNFLGVTGGLRQMAKDGLLILPDAAYSEPVDAALDSSRRAAKGFNLPASPFAYTASGDLVYGARAQFAHLHDAVHISRSGGTRLIPLPAGSAILQATTDGPSLDVRKALMTAALSPDPSDMVALGGSLPNSTWGDSDMAGPTFAWLAAHPWVHVLDGRDLMSFPVGANGLQSASPATGDIFLSDLQTAPNNAVAKSAWQTYLTLTAPASDERLRALRLNYLGQVGTLTAASHWADQPFTLFECSADYDHDLRPECILANESYFAVVETDGARLTHLFYGGHQLVGPTAQFAVGLSDPSVWGALPGDTADPGQIMGAFLDADHPFDPYTTSWPTPGTLTFTSEDGSRVKTFRLTETGLEVTYQVQDPVSIRIPLVVDPQMFFSGPSDYRASLSATSWTWGLAAGIQVQVRTDAALSAQGFTVSMPFLGLPENPNLDYPAGHYFPFPLSVVSICSNGNFYIQIGVK